MRTVFCACGQRLVADDDIALARVYREHADTVHPDMNITDQKIDAVIKATANDIDASHGTWNNQPHDASGEVF